MAIIDGYDPWKHVAQLEGELEAAEQHVKILRSVHKDLDCKIVGLEAELRSHKAYKEQRDFYRQQLAAIMDEREKYRLAATVMCGAHIGVPQKECPVCRCEELLGKPVMQTEWEKLVAENAALKDQIEELNTEIYNLHRWWA